MTANSTTAPFAAEGDPAPPATLRWRSWPLVDRPRWSWLAPIIMVTAGLVVANLAQSWLAGAAATAALGAALWEVLLPVRYEIDSLGLYRSVLGRARRVPWHAVRSYQPRETGVVLFQRPDATAVDALRGLFVPYAADEDETLLSMRQYLRHAVELQPR